MGVEDVFGGGEGLCEGGGGEGRGGGGDEVEMEGGEGLE